MYIPPELNRAGDAREVVLGMSQLGSDLDGTSIMTDFPLPTYPGGDLEQD